MIEEYISSEDATGFTETDKILSHMVSDSKRMLASCIFYLLLSYFQSSFIRNVSHVLPISDKIGS